MDQIREQFYRAIVLCTGASNVKERLANAWVYHLDDIRVDSLPEPARIEFAALREHMYSVTAMPDEHPARAAIRKMSARDAAGHMRTLLVLYRLLLQLAHTRLQDRKRADIASPSAAPARENPPRLN
jgi:hypothetical protein